MANVFFESRCMR